MGAVVRPGGRYVPYCPLLAWLSGRALGGKAAIVGVGVWGPLPDLRVIIGFFGVHRKAEPFTSQVARLCCILLCRVQPHGRGDPRVSLP